MVMGRNRKRNLRELKSIVDRVEGKGYEQVSRLVTGTEASAAEGGDRLYSGWSAVVDSGILTGDLVELLGYEPGDDIGADSGVVAAVVEEADGEGQQGVAGNSI